MMMLDRPTVYDLYEIRELLEVHLAGRAAERRTPDDLAAMVLALERMRATLFDVANYQPHHIAFHQALADAAHNPVFSRIISCLHEGIRACAEATAPGVLDPLHTFTIHEYIFDAVRQQDTTEARRCMTIHFAMAIEELRIAEQAAKRLHPPAAAPISSLIVSPTPLPSPIADALPIPTTGEGKGE
jgi:GntR family transcriptional repressor for pyruvate dehydrogenase complex